MNLMDALLMSDWNEDDTLLLMVEVVGQLAQVVAGETVENI